MAGLLNGKQLIDGSVTPDKLSEHYLQVNEEGVVNGDLIVTGNTTLSETATYKGSEIATKGDLYDEGGINDLINELDEKKQDNLIAGENISIEGVTISSSTKVANSDRVLTYDTAGLKANITLVTNGNQIRIEGKTDDSGDPYILGEFNVLQSQIIDEVYIEDGHLFITFIVDGDPGKEKVDIDLSEFIDIYEGSQYIDITGQEVSLKYNEVRDQLINDGMASIGEIPTDYVDLTTTQTISGRKTLSSTLITSGIYPVTSAAHAIGTSTDRYTNTYLSGQLYAGPDKSATKDGKTGVAVVGGTGRIHLTGLTNEIGGHPALEFYQVGETERDSYLIARNGGLYTTKFAVNASPSDEHSLNVGGPANFSGTVRFGSPINVVPAGGLTVNNVRVATIDDIPEVPEAVYIKIYSINNPSADWDTDLFRQVEYAYNNKLPLYVISTLEESVYPVVSGINFGNNFEYRFAIIADITFSNLYVSYIGVRVDASLYVQRRQIPLTAVSDTLQVSDSILQFELITDPTQLELGEVTALRYENTSHTTGALQLSGGVEGKEYQYSINNKAEHDLALTLPDGKKWVIAGGEFGVLKIYYFFGKYACKVIL